MTITANHITKLDGAILSAAPASAGHPLVPLPYWQDQPCPAWCVYGPHEDSELPDDRCHLGASREVTLTLEAAEITRCDTEVLEVFPAGLSAYLDQEWREREARVNLSHNGATGIDLALSEAGELARALAGLAVTVSAQGDQCPSWCISGPHADPSIGDRNHIGDYTDVTLTLEDADVSVTGGPRPARPEFLLQLRLLHVRPWQGWREREARIDIVYRDEYIALTLAEAKELAEALSGLVADAAV